jgi:hypothetical protein
LATPSEETLCGPRSALEDCFIDADPDMPPGLSQMAEYLVARLQIRQADRLAPFGLVLRVPVVLQKQIPTGHARDRGDHPSDAD